VWLEAFIVSLEAFQPALVPSSLHTSVHAYTCPEKPAESAEGLLKHSQVLLSSAHLLAAGAAIMPPAEVFSLFVDMREAGVATAPSRSHDSFCHPAAAVPDTQKLCGACPPGLPKQLPRRHSFGSASLPQLPRTDSLDCPRVPGLVWGRLVGCGSFGRVYKGAPSHTENKSWVGGS
jgi:hypothetical protein